MHLQTEAIVLILLLFFSLSQIYLRSLFSAEQLVLLELSPGTAHFTAEAKISRR